MTVLTAITLNLKSCVGGEYLVVMFFTTVWSFITMILNIGAFVSFYGGDIYGIWALMGVLCIIPLMYISVAFPLIGLAITIFIATVVPDYLTEAVEFLDGIFN